MTKKGLAGPLRVQAPCIEVAQLMLAPNIIAVPVEFVEQPCRCPGPIKHPYEPHDNGTEEDSGNDA